MQTKSIFVSFLKFVTCASLVLGMASLAQAQEKKAEAKVDGTWKWTQPGRNGGPDRTNTLTLKAEGAKLTGSVATPSRNGGTNQTAIADGTLKDGQVAFTVAREINGGKMVVKYGGKLEGDVIKGKAEVERDGQVNSRDWEAKRQ